MPQKQHFIKKFPKSCVMLLFSVMCIGIHCCKLLPLENWLYNIIMVSLAFSFIITIGEEGREYFTRDIVLKKLCPRVIYPLYISAGLYLLGALSPMFAFAVVACTLFCTELTNTEHRLSVKLQIIFVRALSMVTILGLTALNKNLDSSIAIALSNALLISTDSLKILIVFTTPLIQIYTNFCIRVVSNKFKNIDYVMLIGMIGLLGLLWVYLEVSQYSLLVKAFLPMWVALFKDGRVLNNLCDLPYVFINCVFGETIPALNFSNDLPKKYVAKNTTDVITLIKNIIVIAKTRIVTYKRNCKPAKVKTYIETCITTFYWKLWFTWDYKKTQQYRM